MYAHFWLVMFCVLLVLLVGEMIITSVTLVIIHIVTTFVNGTSGRAYDTPFQVYWNIPTFMCRRYNIQIENATQQYGIIHNSNDEFRGDKLAILYDPGKFPAILKNSSSKKLFLRNHGVPQEGSLFDHLQVFEQHVNELIPDRNFSGVAIIDFESWRPIYRQNFGSLQPYKDLSMHIERQRHPRWPNRRLEREAIKRFEAAGRQFMEETLWLAQRMRPEANWGYYAFPYCFNGRGNNREACPLNVRQENEGIQWLFDSSDILFPSVYFTEQISRDDRIPMIRGRVAEAIRLSRKVQEDPKPQVFVYHRYVYTDTQRYISEADTYAILHSIKKSGADAVILWGSSHDLNSKEKCMEFYEYFVNTLGPVIGSLHPSFSVRLANPEGDI